MTTELTDILCHFALYRFKNKYWELNIGERAKFHREWMARLQKTCHNMDTYQVFPVDNGADILIWSVVVVQNNDDAIQFFAKYARSTNQFRGLIDPVVNLWGYAQPLQHSQICSIQEIAPLAKNRKKYMVVYPIVRTAEWYATSHKIRQDMMNEYLKLGAEYPQISQLLINSFNLQNHESIIAYETNDVQSLSRFMNDLHHTQTWCYVQRNTPMHTAIYHPAEETLALWR
ncbi:MAG: hypothetical protein B6242_05425 [Anaerolineaceae bacterium 4572_78]|nr:MAG: hypothetical protein B6242_05425 [Anaerolineaceae bacterium 4572_78]